MAFILKGKSALIDVPCNVEFTDCDKDNFVCTVKRGGEDAYLALRAKAESGDYTDRQLLDDNVVKLSHLVGADGMPYGNAGVLNWVTQERMTQQEPLTQEEHDAAQVIDLMMSVHPYRLALVQAVFSGAANRQIYATQRLGN